MNAEKDHQYDIILNSVDDINASAITQAKVNRATRISKEEGTRVEPETVLAKDLGVSSYDVAAYSFIAAKNGKNIQNY